MANLETDSSVQYFIREVYDGELVTLETLSTRKLEKEDLQNILNKVKSAGVIMRQSDPSQDEGAYVRIEEEKIVMAVDLNAKEGVFDAVHELTHLNQVVQALANGLSSSGIQEIIENGYKESPEDWARTLLGEIQAHDVETAQWALHGYDERVAQNRNQGNSLRESFADNYGRVCPEDVKDINPLTVDLGNFEEAN